LLLFLQKKKILSCLLVAFRTALIHALTHGFLAGEVIRRITGQDVGGFIRDAVLGD